MSEFMSHCHPILDQVQKVQAPQQGAQIEVNAVVIAIVIFDQKSGWGFRESAK